MGTTRFGRGIPHARHLTFWSRCMSHFHLSVLTTLTQISFVSMGPGLVGEPRCGSQCRTFVRRLHTPVLAKHRRMLRSPYAVVLAYLLSEQSLTSLNGALPSEPYMRLSTHTAQALNNAPAWHDRARFHRPTTPLTERGRPIGLGVNLDGTSTEPATEIGGGRTTGVAARVRSALPPEPVGCRSPSADTRRKSARFRAG